MGKDTSESVQAIERARRTDGRKEGSDTMEVIAAIVTFAAGSVAAVVSGYWGPKWLKRAAARTGAQAGLKEILFYVESAQKMPDHQDLQTKWSQTCVHLFGKVLTHAIELGKESRLDEVAELLGGWLEQSPYIGGNDPKVKALGEHLRKVGPALGRAINSVDGR